MSYKQIGALSIAAGLLLSGCASSEKMPARTGDPVLDGKAAISQGPTKDRVLWEYRTGLASLRRGDIADAQKEFGDALLTIGNIYGNDKTAKKARSYFSEESKKTFLGEPYERVMAYFYRGVIYWMNGEPDNARACFRSAQIQDSDPENREYANDWVLMDYLDGLASVKMNGDGSDALKRAEKSFKIGKLPEYNKNSNTLVFFEFGEGPTKYATGEYREELRIYPGRSVVRGALLNVDNRSVRIAPYDDVNFQAMTRGGRVMDHILANKAVFKSVTDTAGNVAILGGAIAATQRGGGEIGLGLIAAGVIGKVVAAATTPEADVRSWNNLPQFLSFYGLELPPGPHTATIQFTDGAGNAIPSKTKTINFNVSTGSDTVLFVSDRNS